MSWCVQDGPACLPTHLCCAPAWPGLRAHTPACSAVQLRGLISELEGQVAASRADAAGAHTQLAAGQASWGRERLGLEAQLQVAEVCGVWTGRVGGGWGEGWPSWLTWGGGTSQAWGGTSQARGQRGWLWQGCSLVGFSCTSGYSGAVVAVGYVVAVVGL